MPPDKRNESTNNSCTKNKNKNKKCINQTKLPQLNQNRDHRKAKDDAEIKAGTYLGRRKNGNPRFGGNGGKLRKEERKNW